MTFQPPPLTRERLAVILRALKRRGGEMKARDLARFNGVDWWEIDQAEEAGFITTEKRKPKTGRPSKWVHLIDPAHKDEKVSKTQQTKPLPSRANMEREITRKEWSFALWYVVGEFGPGTGLFGFKRRAWTAYMKAYPSCHSKAAARASASRLLKRPRVKAAIAWQFAEIDNLTNIHHFFPHTATEIWDILHRLGSERARWAPAHIQRRWIIANLQAQEKPHGLD